MESILSFLLQNLSNLVVWKTFTINNANRFYYKADEFCFDYISETLGDNIHKYIPINVPGDGNCLLHSISMSIRGEVDDNQELREILSEELKIYFEWYHENIPEITEEEWKNINVCALTDKKDLDFIHIFALSNALKRPIVLLASLENQVKFGQGSV